MTLPFFIIDVIHDKGNVIYTCDQVTISQDMIITSEYIIDL